MAILVISFLCLLPWSAFTHDNDSWELKMKSHFSNFMTTFNRTYEDEEQEMRFEIFKQNLKNAVDRNQNTGEEIYGITKFSDWTTEEFNELLGTNPDEFSRPQSSCPYGNPPTVNVPPSLDYHALNKVSPVMQQGSCGSCYAISVIGQLESQMAIKHNKELSLSVQQIVDCDRKSLGCDKGFLTTALKYLIDIGSMQERDYPYVAKQGQCRHDPSKAKVKVTSCKSFQITNEEGQLSSLLNQHGPISLAVAASDWKHYRGGIMRDCTSTNIDHGVLLVGYGTEGGVNFWKIKNSWGADWGERGYIRIQSGRNQCNLLQIPAVIGTVA